MQQGLIMTSAEAKNAVVSVDLPVGFACHVGNVGMKDDTDDVMVLAADRVSAAAGVFTKSLFAASSVRLSRRNVTDGQAQAVVVVSKNANVATGEQGERDTANLAQRVAEFVGCEPGQVLVGSTGVIGVPYPEGKIDAYFDQLAAAAEGTVPAAERADGPMARRGGPTGDGSVENVNHRGGQGLWKTDAAAAAAAIMTTDTHPKTASASAGAATVVGIAKGSGMIEPDMATMISVITTDAEIAPDQLDAMLRRTCDVTFNALSVDTDTSTSDMVVMLANGAAGPVDETDLEAALAAVSLDLTRQLAFDGEGAETLIVVTVNEARDDAQAKRIAKAIVNSPLVKTAVHGCDPNWGRVAMAIGKRSDETDIDPERVRSDLAAKRCIPRPQRPRPLRSSRRTWLRTRC